uniref:Nuclear cap-binding protein subunit 3 n=1 Tax=Eptatretus burgeri TaxID=7764 RepID=A0A8C4NM03_EPTBU
MAAPVRPGLRLNLKVSVDVDELSGEEEPMDVVEAEEETEEQRAAFGAVTVRRSYKDLLPVTNRRYENKAGTFVTGIDTMSKEAIERKEERARRFHLRNEEGSSWSELQLELSEIRRAIPGVRLEALCLQGVEDFSTEQVFEIFRSYGPASIEWINDSTCNVVWLDEHSATRVLLNLGVLPTEPAAPQPDSTDASDTGRGGDEYLTLTSDCTVGEVDCEGERKTKSQEGKPNPEEAQRQREALLRNEMRTLRGNSTNQRPMLLRFATQADKKELGAARRSRYYLKYGNPNYGGMRGLLSSSWKRRYNSHRLHGDADERREERAGQGRRETVDFRKGRPDSPTDTIPEEDEGAGSEDGGGCDAIRATQRLDHCLATKKDPHGIPNHSKGNRSKAESSSSDEMDYELELRRLGGSTEVPSSGIKLSRMTMYADEVEAQLKRIRKKSSPKYPLEPSKVEENRRDIKSRLGRRGSSKTEEGGSKESPKKGPKDTSNKGVKQRLGKRSHSPKGDRCPISVAVHGEEPSDVHSRLGGYEHTEISTKKEGTLWSRLGTPAGPTGGKVAKSKTSCDSSSLYQHDDDAEVQLAWGAVLRKKSKNRAETLSKLPSLQIKITRRSSESD